MNEALDPAIFDILQARQSATAKEIVQALRLCGVVVDNPEVNSRLYTLKTQGVLECSADKVPVWWKVCTAYAKTAAMDSPINRDPQDRAGLSV